jgi:adenylate cyclase
LKRSITLTPLFADTRALYFGATNLWRVGEHEKAVDMANRALEQGRNEPLVFYNIACLYVDQGDKQHAIDLLEKAVDLGWGDRAWIETDIDLAPLRDDERFKALLARIR